MAERIADTEARIDIAALKAARWTLTSGGYNGLRPHDAVLALVAAVEALAEEHENICGCEAPGSPSRCVMGPHFTPLTRFDFGDGA